VRADFIKYQVSHLTSCELTPTRMGSLPYPHRHDLFVGLLDDFTFISDFGDFREDSTKGIRLPVNEQDENRDLKLDNILWHEWSRSLGQFNQQPQKNGRSNRLCPMLRAEIA